MHIEMVSQNRISRSPRHSVLENMVENIVEGRAIRSNKDHTYRFKSILYISKKLPKVRVILIILYFDENR